MDDDTSSNGYFNVSSAAKKLIKALLSKNPDERPSAQEAFEFEWLREQVR